MPASPDEQPFLPAYTVQRKPLRGRKRAKVALRRGATGAVTGGALGAALGAVSGRRAAVLPSAAVSGAASGALAAATTPRQEYLMRRVHGVSARPTAPNQKPTVYIRGREAAPVPKDDDHGVVGKAASFVDVGLVGKGVIADTIGNAVQTAQGAPGTLSGGLATAHTAYQNTMADLDARAARARKKGLGANLFAAVAKRDTSTLPSEWSKPDPRPGPYDVEARKPADRIRAIKAARDGRMTRSAARTVRARRQWIRASFKPQEIQTIRAARDTRDTQLRAGYRRADDRRQAEEQASNAGVAIRKMSRRQHRDVDEAAAGLGILGASTKHEDLEQLAHRGIKTVQARRIARVVRSTKRPRVDGAELAPYLKEGMSAPARRRASMAPQRAARKAAQPKINAIAHETKLLTRRMPDKVRAPLLVAGMGGGTLAAWHGSRDLAKSLRRRDVDAGFAGGIVGAALPQAVAYGSKPIDDRIDAHQKKISDRMDVQGAPGERSPRDILNEHRKRVGLPRNAEAGHPAWPRFFAEYPKGVPGWRFKRGMARVVSGRSGTAVKLGSVAAGAAAGIATSVHHRQVHKAFELP